MRVDAGCQVTGVPPSGRIDTNCTAFSGNSGGPLLRARSTAPYAEVLGVVSTARFTQGKRATGRDQANTTYASSARLRELLRDARARFPGI